VDAANLGILIFLFIAINGLIAKQMFPGPILTSSDQLSRSSFEDFTTATTTVFIAMTGTWSAQMIDASRVHGWPVSIFFVEVMLVGNFMLLNLFLAILL